MRPLTSREKDLFHRLSNKPQTVMQLTGTYERDDAKNVRQVLMRLREKGMAERQYDPGTGGYVWFKA